MNKIYLGETEVANVGSGGGGGDYVLNSSFDEMSRVAASALLDLKGLEDKLDEHEQALEDQEAALLAEVHVVEQTKADVSVVYLKTDIDKADKVAAAALASLDDRVSELESGGGGGITPAQLDASLKEYTYDKAWIDASIDAIEPGVSYAELDASLKEYTYDKAYLDASFSAIDINPISEILTDVSTRVDALEDANFIDSAQLDASLKEYAYSKSYVDASIQALDASIVALDASALAFDASIKELAEGGGGGGGGITPAQLDASLREYTYDKAHIDASSLTYFKPGVINNNIGRTSGNRTLIQGQNNSISYGNQDTAILINGIYNNISSGNNNKGVTVLSSHQQYNNYIKLTGCQGTLVQVYSYVDGYGDKMNIQGYGNTITGYYNQNFGSKISCVSTGINSRGCHIEGYCHNIRIGDLYGIHVEGIENQVSSNAEHAEGQNNISYKQGSTFGSPLNTLSTIGNGVQDSSRHNAFEVRQSGDIYIPDVSAAGEYYEKPMINLQQKIYAIDASINALEQGGGGGGSFDPTNYVFIEQGVEGYKLKSTEPGGTSAYVTDLELETLRTSTVISPNNDTGDYIMFESGKMFVSYGGTNYVIDMDSFLSQFGNRIS